MSTLELLTAINALLNLAADAKINIQKLNDMRNASGGKLTIEDLQELSNDAQTAIDSI